jgi:hypothetical protein
MMVLLTLIKYGLLLKRKGVSIIPAMLTVDALFYTTRSFTNMKFGAYIIEYSI